MNRLLCWGMTSHIPTTELNVVFLDYDFTSLSKLENIAKKLQETFELSNAYIAKTGVKRHHMVFIDKLPLDTWKQVVSQSQCHDGYCFHLDSQGYAILRLIAKGKHHKPCYVKTVHSNHRKWEQSKIHLELLKQFWGAPKRLSCSTPDSNRLWESVYYFTDNLRLLSTPNAV